MAKPSQIINAGVISILHAPLLIHEKLNKVPEVRKNGFNSAESWDRMVPDLDTFFLLMKKRHAVFDATLLTYRKWAQSDATNQWGYTRLQSALPPVHMPLVSLFPPEQIPITNNLLRMKCAYWFQRL